jgi:hypothetical protein
MRVVSSIVSFMLVLNHEGLRKIEPNTQHAGAVLPLESKRCDQFAE